MIDLHIHTSYSDGTDSLEAILKKAETQKLEIISITDHDKIDSYYELEKNPQLRTLFSGKIIIGSELKAIYKDVNIEVLAYGIDYKKIAIPKINNLKIQNNELKILKDIAKNVGFKFNEENLYIDLNDPQKQWASFTLATELLKHQENAKLIKQYGTFTATSFFRDHVSNKKKYFLCKSK